MPFAVKAFKSSGCLWYPKTDPRWKPGLTFRDIAGRQALAGVKQRGSGAAWWDKALDQRRKDATAIKNAGGSSRKFASAMIAKIPLPLSLHIGATFR